jgi:hypothetical protein
VDWIFLQEFSEMSSATEPEIYTNPSGAFGANADLSFRCANKWTASVAKSNPIDISNVLYYFNIIIISHRINVLLSCIICVLFYV